MPTPTLTIPVPSVCVDELVVGRGCGVVDMRGKVRVRRVELGAEGVEDGGRVRVGRVEVEVEAAVEDVGRVRVGRVEVEVEVEVEAEVMVECVGDKGKWKGRGRWKLGIVVDNSRNEIRRWVA